MDEAESAARRTYGGHQEWVLTSDELPPEAVEVDTLGAAGTQQTLTRIGSLWYVPDGSMYVYYTPMFWRRAAMSTDGDRRSTTREG